MDWRAVTGLDRVNAEASGPRWKREEDRGRGSGDSAASTICITYYGGSLERSRGVVRDAQTGEQTTTTTRAC